MSCGPRMSIWCKQAFSLIHAVINYVLRCFSITKGIIFGWHESGMTFYRFSKPISEIMSNIGHDYPKKLMILSCHKLMRLESQTQIKLLNCRSKCITASSLSLIEDNSQTMATQWAVLKSWPETDWQTVLRLFWGELFLFHFV